MKESVLSSVKESLLAWKKMLQVLKEHPKPPNTESYIEYAFFLHVYPYANI